MTKVRPFKWITAKVLGELSGYFEPALFAQFPLLRSFSAALNAMASYGIDNARAVPVRKCRAVSDCQRLQVG
ncbi:hypothetical protein AJ87_41785 [Rhizobium yanglingense]|nr:hypothetical protein AJ87_41785 [Rhizobium yanglingense]